MPVKRRIALSLTVIGVATLTYLPWVIYRGLRYDMWTVARGSRYAFFFEAYDNRLVRPGNGPATDRLTDLVRQHLLAHPKYQSARVSLVRFLHLDGRRWYDGPYAANEYMPDIVYVVDKYAGWNTNYALLLDVAKEAFWARPAEFGRKLLSGVGTVFLDYDIRYLTDRSAPAPLVLSGELRRPPIYSIVFSHPNTTPEPSVEWARADRRTALNLLSRLPEADGDMALVATLVASWTAVWPPLWVTYALTVIGIVTSRGTGLAFLLIHVVLAAGLVGFSSLFGNVPRYRLPVESVFLMTGVIGFAYVSSTLWGASAASRRCRASTRR
jgi:hypothetical protein